MDDVKAEDFSRPEPVYKPPTPERLGGAHRVLATLDEERGDPLTASDLTGLEFALRQALREKEEHGV